jgi:hypothetical protein
VLKQQNADLKAQNEGLRRRRDSLANLLTDGDVSNAFRKGEF